MQSVLRFGPPSDNATWQSASTRSTISTRAARPFQLIPSTSIDATVVYSAVSPRFGQRQTTVENDPLPAAQEACGMNGLCAANLRILSCREKTLVGDENRRQRTQRREVAKIREGHEAMRCDKLSPVAFSFFALHCGLATLRRSRTTWSRPDCSIALIGYSRRFCLALPAPAPPPTAGSGR